MSLSWIWFAAFIAAAIVFGTFVWLKWIAPWTRVDELTREIVRGATPRTFLIEGAEAPRRVALSLEDLFKRQRDLHRRLAEDTSGTAAIFAAMQDGLLVADASRRVTLVNRTFQEWFGLTGLSGPTPLLEVVREPDIERLIRETLSTAKRNARI